ncbi:hypothetical protein ACOI1H_21185 [Loktanella sp. DJP18]|uniref:hypothetical protein n=1 Tax=Loktanella sp. DJP18 TaxID=3409788 RepID=UPI003BB73392
MKPSEFEAKVHEMENALNERRDEIARTKTSEAEKQELLATQERVKIPLEDVDKMNGEEEKREFIRQANELLLEIRRSPM